MNLGIIFGLFLILVFLGIPIAMVLCFLGILPNLLNPWFPADTAYIIRAMISGVNSFPLMAVPMFILSGNIMARGKISDKIFEFFSYFIADKRAGLPIATVITCLFYGAISGSGPATCAAVGSMTIPIMTEFGYDKSFATALVACAGALGVIIPPSIPLIFYGQSAGLSVSDLFIGGILPGLLFGLMLIIYAYYYCLKNGEDREKLKEYSRKVRIKGFLNLFKSSFFALLSPLIILGSIYSGIASPTEAAVISVFYSLFIGLFIYKSIKIGDIYYIFKDSVKTYGGILFIIAGATAFARVLAFMKAGLVISNLITNVVSSKIGLLIIINILLLFVGMIMDTSPAILILTPIFMPIISSYGINPIHFGLIMVVNLAIGFVTPPVGVNLFVASSLSDLPLEKIMVKALPFIIVFIIALLLITFIPQISLLLVGGKWKKI